ncbi:MAG: hypothetical protein MZV49_14535 [Rhodopseudomonas palustris]|nr:hypothetical protein [Rhodopseudomonas palustris]
MAAALAWSARLLAWRTWAAMPSAECVNLSAACEKLVGGAVRGAGLSGQRVGTFADRMQRGGGRLRAVGDRIGGALQLPDQAAKLGFQQFEDLVRVVATIVVGAVVAPAAGQRQQAAARGASEKPESIACERDPTPWHFRPALRNSGKAGISR